MSSQAEKSMGVYEILQGNYKKRAKQAAYIHHLIEASPYPVLACGDMNSNPSSYTYHQIKGKLKDGFKTCGRGYEYTMLGLYRLYRIDYIFHSRDFDGYSYKSYKLDYSDHKPVIMNLALKK
jgi:endonuclease/exonuclease/phosphatase family metal-dependent hydrolase